MSRLSVLIPALLLCSAVARNLVRGAGRPSLVASAALPGSVDGVEGKPQPLGPSERVLVRSPNVSLERRRYGTTQAALVSTTGVREIHPPRVCLKAMGLEVVRRREEQNPEGCVTHLEVRDRKSAPRTPVTAHFFHTYLGEEGGRCDFWGRTGAAVFARLAGRPSRFTTLQVMDRDPRRARRVLHALAARIAASRETRRER